MPALVGGRLRQRHTERHFKQTDKWRGHLYAAEIQSVGALDLCHKTALHVKKRRKDAGDWLARHRNKSLGRRYRVAYWRFNFTQNVVLPGRVLEWARAGQSASACLGDRLFQSLRFHMPDHRQMRQALLDRPCRG